ncbi:MAG: HDOD domain-containing protein [Gammaproteobacteria bacterium]|nr:HDOD domain-containing protein [Gammaproteobacteria bacterium]
MPSVNNAISLDLGKLPSVPHVLLQLVEACHKIDVSFDELADIIQKDAAICSKVISVANSPAYKQWNNIDSLNRLLVVLGIGPIKSIAITSAVHQFFSQFDADLEKSMGKFWRGSLTCAYTAKALATLTGYPSVDEAHVAGLLHNIGQLVFLSNYPSDYPELLLSSHSDAELDDRERALWGATNSEIGAFLVDQWNVDPFLSDAILYQHEPAGTILDSARLVKLLNFAHKLSENGVAQEILFEEADLLFGLSQPVIEDLQKRVEEQVEEAARSFGIKLDADNATLHATGEKTRLAMAKKVREFALLDGVRQHLDQLTCPDQLLNAVLQNLNILFGLTSSICFLYDLEADCLQGAMGNCGEIERLTELNLPLKPGRSIVAESLLQRKVVSTFDSIAEQLPSVVDGQLCRVLGSEGFICAPLVNGQQNIGVMVSGIAHEQAANLQNQREMLSCFAGVITQNITRYQRLSAEQERLIEDERTRQNAEARKLAHEANNPLGVMRNYLEVLSQKLADNESVQNPLAILKEEIDRVGNIVLRMKDTTTTEELSEGRVDINQLINDLIGIFRVSHFSTHNIRDALNLDQSIPPLISDRNRVKQVLTNLIKNAVEALPNGGVISITTRDQVNLNGAQFVELRIRDDGPGIPETILNRIFTPVESTKGPNNSGLGLTIVNNLMADLNGTISCGNSREGGAEFVIMLPRKLEA